jgi:hypothetical protein
MKSIPPTTVAPGTLIAPPFPGTLLTVVYWRAVSNSQSFWPFAVESAVRVPSFPPMNATPGMSEVAAL